MADFDINEDVKRARSIREQDDGFYVLALFSLIERTFRAEFGKLSMGDYDNFSSLKFEYEHAKDLLPEQKKILNTLKKQHKITNLVRHCFGKLTLEESKSATEQFYLFATKVEKWGIFSEVKNLKIDIDNGYTTKVSDDFRRLSLEIEKLKNNNNNLNSQLEKYLEIEKESEKLQSEVEKLKFSLNCEREKRDRLRYEYHLLKEEDKKKKAELENTENEIKQLQLKLVDFEYTVESKEKEVEEYIDAKVYLDYLRRVSLCTQTQLEYIKSIQELSKQQEELVNKINLSQDYIVKGVAGTGKTFVLIGLLKRILSEEKSKGLKIKFVTFTNSLVKYSKLISKITDEINGSENNDAICSVDAMLQNLLVQYFQDKKICYNSNKYLYAKVKNMFSSEKISNCDVFTEAIEFIWANNIKKEEYTDTKSRERLGMKYPLNENQRMKMFSDIEKGEEQLKNYSYWPKEYAAKMILEQEVKEDAVYDYIFVDEVQDLQPVIISLIKKHARKAVFFAGDSDQSIFHKGSFTWKRLGIKGIGHTTILKRNYRNTIQINNVAEKFRQKTDNRDFENISDAFRPGLPVQMELEDSVAKLIDKICKQVVFLRDGLGYDLTNICIITDNSQPNQNMKVIEEKLNSFGIDSIKIKDESFNFENDNAVRLTTIQSSKGIDFPVVLFFATESIFEYLKNDEIYDESEIEKLQRDLIYVALTRSTDLLYVYSLKDGQNKILRDLSDSIQHEQFVLDNMK